MSVKSGMLRRVATTAAALAVGLLAPGCQWFADEADKEVYALIDQRQQDSIGIRSNVNIGGSTVPGAPSDRAYAFVPPSPPPEVPPEFVASSQPVEGADTQPTSAAADTQPAGHEAPPRVMTFTQLIRFALENARDYQTAKEDLYLAALDLTLERFLWTPQLVGEISSQFADYGQIDNFDRAMEAVVEFAAEQRLPYGGTVTARTINVLMRDLGRHITSGETGQMILEANIPLLRGAGRVNYESRYQAERDLIYAVRSFEHFRRTFIDDVIAAYLELVNLRQQIENARLQVDSLRQNLARSEAMNEAGRVDILDLGRVRNDLLSGENNVVLAIQRYQTALDVFKIRIGMVVTEPLELAEEAPLFVRVPPLDEAAAVETALNYRLDLINFRDRVDDARRQVEIAKNGLLPDLTIAGSVTMDTDPDELNMLNYDIERLTWRGSAALEIPLQRKEERNALRDAMIQWHRTERSYSLQQDQVRQQVRAAIRNMIAARERLEIQVANVEITENQSEAATIKFDLGEISNRDKVDAEQDLLEARDQLASATAEFHRAIVAFYRDTGTLRIEDDGRWLDVARPIE